MAKNTHPDYSKYRAWTLLSVWVFFALHMVHWRLNETTLAPLELNEVLYTLHQGIVTAGFILMVVIMIATLIFGRFFCSWGCHILSLQDACYWILRKLKIRSRPIRSRALIWVPMGAMLYLFVWPQILLYMHGVETEALHVVENTDGQWSSFVTDDFWRNLPPVEIALGTFFIVGFLLIYLLGSRAFCFYGCPYGALFGLADQAAPGRIKLTGDCKQCGVCTVNCGSDILVHKEIKEFGMVTNSKCFKDLDCIAGCPENALSFGFTSPPLFQSKYKLPEYKSRYSFTVAEDILLAVVFVFSVFVFRGLYGIIPFLMSVGMSVATAYVSLLTLRLFTRSSTSINDLRLKISKKIRLPGYVFLTVSAVLFVFTLHSAYIQYHSYAGLHWYEKLGVAKVSDDNEEDSQELASKALAHLETAYERGLMKPVHLRTQMASIFLLQNSDNKAREQLEVILDMDSENTAALYRLAILEKTNGNTQQSLLHFRSVTEIDVEDAEGHYMKSASHMELAKHALKTGDKEQSLKHILSATTENQKNSEAWMALGIHSFRNGDTKKAIESLERSLELEPKSAVAHNNLGAIYAQTGNAKKALQHFRTLTELQPSNKQAHYNLGMMQMRIGQMQLAITSMNHALKIDPNYTLAAQGLARIKNELKQEN